MAMTARSRLGHVGTAHDARWPPYTELVANGSDDHVPDGEARRCDEREQRLRVAQHGPMPQSRRGATPAGSRRGSA